MSVLFRFGSFPTQKIFFARILRNQNSQNVSSLFPFFIYFLFGAFKEQFAASFYASVEKKRPAHEGTLWAFFDKWAQNIFG